MMRRLLALATLLLAASCATMVNGRYQEVRVDSFPGRAAVTVDCGDAPRDAGRTPVTLKLPRGAATCQLTLSKEGYRDRVVVLERQISRAVDANRIVGAPVAVLTSVVGMVIDDELGTAGAAEFGWNAGLDLGSAPGRQIDKHTGAAWKWVPADVFITLLRPEPEPQ